MNEPHSLFAAPQADLRAQDSASLGARFRGSPSDGLIFLVVLLPCVLIFGVDFGALAAIPGAAGTMTSLTPS